MRRFHCKMFSLRKKVTQNRNNFISLSLVLSKPINKFFASLCSILLLIFLFASKRKETELIFLLFTSIQLQFFISFRFHFLFPFQRQTLINHVYFHSVYVRTFPTVFPTPDDSSTYRRRLCHRNCHYTSRAKKISEDFNQNLVTTKCINSFPFTAVW